MKRNRRRALGIFLSIAFLLNWLPALGDEQPVEWAYVIREDGAVITGYMGILPGNLVIPSEIEGRPVVELGDSVFAQCALSAVRLPATLKAIGSFCFFESSLDLIDLPDSLEKIGVGAFAGSRCGSILLNDSQEHFFLADGLMYQKENQELLFALDRDFYQVQDGTVKIGDYAFYGKKSLNLFIPETVTAIGSYAFYDASFSRLVLPDTVEEIGDYAFSNVTLLIRAASAGDADAAGYTQILSEAGALRMRLAMPAALKEMGAHAFEKIQVEISDQAVKYQEEESELDMRACARLEEIPDYAFYGVPFAVFLPEALSSIGAYSLNACARYEKTGRAYELDGLILPETTRAIGEGAFENARIAWMLIPAGVESIGPGAFADSMILNVYRGSYGEEYCWNNDSQFFLVDEAVLPEASGETADK